MPRLKVKLEFDVEIERVNESEDYGLSDYEVKDYFEFFKNKLETMIENKYKYATVESDLTVKFDE